MRRLMITCGLSAIALLAPVGGASAQTDCLTAEEARDVAQTRRVITPERAARIARTSYPGHDVLRALLCRENNGYVYVVTVLTRDGRVIRTRVDANSGRQY